ncbi:hypothetical protein B7P43_G02650 [Cryptotermes secundus]|uniref:Uncharacterized protein n=1 Tax=Cryptotermes secundus TaxID=105785 RepID=A0A2J7QCE3_9NEOP|nr:hypothetical protein B7P43_G02650 [Cryptotermes secundus]
MDSSTPGTTEPVMSASRKTTHILKPAGTGDNFTGDTAACGKSVVQVAHEMIAGSKLVRGFSTNGNEKAATGEGFNRGMRRGSAFALERANIHATDVQESANKYPGSWILSGLLGQQQRDNLSDSADSLTIPEGEQEKEVQKPKSHVPKDDQHVEVGVDVTAVSGGCDSPTQKNKTFRAKPSELREMNFWSPTSM